MPDLPVLHSFAEETALLTRNIREAGTGDGPVRVLEAGCGRAWDLTPEGVEVQLTGVDTDPDALRIRKEQRGDLDVAILGDLRSVDLPHSAFDAVYCAYVLEHVEGAVAALENMRNALRPGGRLIVRVPDGKSVYGFFVRHSPHRVHVWYMRYVRKKPHAGHPGHAPYPTVYDPVVSLAGLREWARGNDMEIVAEYGTDTYLSAFGRLRPLAAGVFRLITRLTRGKLEWRHANIGVVMVRRR